MDTGGWTVLIAGATLFTGVLVGLWALMQSQLSALERAQKLKNDCQDEDVQAIRYELERREVELKRQIEKIEDELARRRSEFVHADAFSQFQKAADDRWNMQSVINERAVESYLSAKAWEAWRAERDKLIERIEQQIDKIGALPPKA